MNKDNSKIGGESILVAFAAVGLGGKWIWKRRAKIKNKLKGIFKKAKEKILGENPQIDEIERKKLIALIISDKENILNALIKSAKDINPDLEIIRGLSKEEINEPSRHHFNIELKEIFKIELQKIEKLEEEIYFLTYELLFALLQSLFYKNKSITTYQKKIESNLACFLVLSEFDIEIEKDKLINLDNHLQDKESPWINDQESKNRINEATEIILSRIYGFFKEKHSQHLNENSIENKKIENKNNKDAIKEIIKDISDLELVRLNKIIKVFYESRYIKLKELIKEFQSIHKGNKDIDNLLRIFLSYSNDLYSGPDINEINLTGSIKVTDLLDLIREKSENLIFSDKNIEILKIYLKEPKGEKRLNWNSSAKDIHEKLLISISQNDLNNIKNEIALSWFKEKNFLQIPSAEQLKFIINTENSIKLTARAGSGKTTTISLKILFLIHFYGLKPEEMLITTFNKKAITELKEKIEDIEVKTKLVEKPNKYFVYNFDVICHAILGSRQDVVDGKKDGEINVIKNIIKTLFEKDNNESTKIKNFIIKAFQSDWTTWFDNHGNKFTEAKLLKLKENSIIKLIDGTRVESLGEKRIGDFLFEHQIDFKYEKILGNFEYKNYKPDFYLEEYQCVIEFFGMEGDKKYNSEILKKREAFLNQEKLKLIEIYPRDFKRFGDYFLDNKESDYETIANKINNALGKDLNILSRRLTDEEIVEKINFEEESESFKYFVQLYQSVIQKTQQRCSSLPEVFAFINSYKAQNKLEKEFIDLIPTLYRLYREKLKSLNKTNFSLVKWEAIDYLKKGTNKICKDGMELVFDNLEFIFIDEFQDFSKLYQEIILNIVKFSEKIKVNTVGDDIQLINRFMGSELKFFNEFSKIYRNPLQLELTENRRSAKEIIEFCNQLIANNPKYLGEDTALAKLCEENKSLKGRVSNLDISELRPEDIENKEFDSDKLIISLMRIVEYSRKFLDLKERPKDDKPSYFILSRFNKLITKGKAKNISLLTNQKNNENLINKLLEKVFNKIIPPKFIQIKTSHSSKGSQATSVIIPDLHNFPYIHPSSQFLGIFDDTPETLIRDDLKLLYVACSRAKEDLIFISDKNKKQYDFFNVLPEETKWDKAEKNYEIFGEYFKVEIKILDSKEFIKAKDLIKSQGFTFDKDKNKIWKKSFTDKNTCINSISALRNKLKLLDARLVLRFLTANNDLEIEIKLPGKDFWDDYLNSHNLKKELKN